MITDTTKKTLVAFSTISLFTTIFGNLMPNVILAATNNNFLDEIKNIIDERIFTLDLEQLAVHERYGVCGFGMITGFLLVLLLIIQVSILNNLDNKDIQSRKNLAVTTLVIILLYFFIQLSANSFISHTYRNIDEPTVGLWEFMLPTYICQFIILGILFSETEIDEKTI